MAAVPSSGSLLTLNPTPSEQLTAQANTFIHTILTHNFIRDRAPGFTAISIPLTANTGVSGTCNAFFSGANLSINFYNAGGGCANTAFSSVIAHEYGHFIVNRRGLVQGSFGEGYSDAVSILLYDDPIIGRGFQTNGNPVRNPLAANIQVPCSGGSSVHFCGQVMGAVWIRIRQNLGASLGSQAGLDRARDLFAAYTVATGNGWGTSGSPSVEVTTQMAIEILTVDDNDGNIGNGTPNYTQICQALAGSSIPCPPLQLVSYSFPNGLPTTLAPNQPTTVAVNITGVAGTPVPSTARVLTRVGTSGSFVSTPMASIGTNQYLATLPGVDCPQTLQYYFAIDTSASQTATSPANAPTTVYSAVSAASSQVVADLNFNADRRSAARSGGSRPRTTEHYRAGIRTASAVVRRAGDR
ncbi:hypothetical protein J4558_25095 [Leptolyngbya sp. 15MV]|nr:hypothetical protein J4558_25095 [Leptolyngbya sp. 15MV]